ncbi:unnamed protein product [Medioppia subpectinata]|uniref:CID domain-containing protein n=2 Tax=Medioppia subpectinata TaxID=1979941 RepID=A0A7R9KT71_9ACAR|nr:unnamed protein product [Medioppia subpectinata]CAG2109364.1 unnamed protein product [Medioppia subpectinata]
MSGFAAQTLEKKLIDLNSSQQSIQTLSLWLIHHRKHHKSIVQTWFAELKKAKAVRRLTFMYLANDIIQNSRKKGPEFSKEFGAVLAASFESVAKDSDDKTLGSLERILAIWEERQIYDSNDIKSFRSSLTLRKNQQSVKDVNNSSKTNDLKPNEAKEAKRSDHKKDAQKGSKDSKPKTDKKEPKKRSVEKNSKHTNPPKKRSTDESTNSVIIPKQKLAKIVESIEKKTPVLNSGAPVDSEALIKALQELENSASADAGVRQKIASLPNEVFDATLLDKIRDKGAAERLTKLVDEARSLLADYNTRLTRELDDRKQMSQLLRNYTQNQRHALSVAEQKLNEYKEKLQKVVHVRNELKSHLQNLPDLSRLPSVTGLAPLPSACDLFNVARIGGNSAGSVTSSVSPNESNASPIDYELTPGSNTS